MMKSTFIFDMNKCVGCHACMVACHNENGTSTNIPWREINTFNKDKHPLLPVFYYSLACNHCEEAPCKKNCPALAYSRDKETGAIIHNAEKCIGCEYCTWACPYDAPKPLKNEGVISKCTFCIDKLKDGQKPACALLCPTGALDFTKAEINNAKIDAPGFINKNIAPSIQVRKLRKSKAPEMNRDLFSNLDLEQETNKEKRKISAKHEWPLVLFTLIVPFMVGMYWAYSETNLLENSLLFALLGIGAASLSLMHLGKKLRAWRSILNIKNSWLSREIFLFSAFFSVGLFSLVIYTSPVIMLISLFLGLGTLIAIDRVYYMNERFHPVKTHSALTIFTGFLAGAFLNHQYETAIAILILKILLFSWRKAYFIKHNINFNPVASIVQFFSAVVSILLLWYKPGIHVLIPIITGEIIDRIDFYNEMYVITPQRSLNHLLEEEKNNEH